MQTQNFSKNLYRNPQERCCFGFRLDLDKWCLENSSSGITGKAVFKWCSQQNWVAVEKSWWVKKAQDWKKKKVKKWNNVETRLLDKKMMKRTTPKAGTVTSTNTTQNTGLEGQIKHGQKEKKRRKIIQLIFARSTGSLGVWRKRSEFKEVESLPMCREQKSTKRGRSKLNKKLRGWKLIWTASCSRHSTSW